MSHRMTPREAGDGERRGQGRSTYVCEFLEPLALPPDLPPPVIVIDFLVWESEKWVIRW